MKARAGVARTMPYERKKSTLMHCAGTNMVLYHTPHLDKLTTSHLSRGNKSTRNLTMVRNGRVGHLEPMGRSSLQPATQEGVINALVLSTTSSSVARRNNHLGSAQQCLSVSQRRWKTFRKTCRNIFEFMFTQVGVGGIVIAYTIVGAFIFQAIELSSNQTNDIKPIPPVWANSTTYRLKTILSLSEKVAILRLSTLAEVWKLTETHNIFNRTRWTADVSAALFDHQEDMVTLIQQGYEEQTLEEKWSFPASLMFTLRYVHEYCVNNSYFIIL